MNDLQDRLTPAPALAAPPAAPETPGGAEGRLSRAQRWRLGLVLAVSVSLHLVPQLFARWIDPALTMIGLMLLDALVFAWIAHSRRHTHGSLPLVALFALILMVTWVSRLHHFVALPFIVLNLALAVLFGVTLRAGSAPLIYRIAAHAFPHETIDADYARYMRQLTLAWVVFFVAMALTSALLALAAPFAWWSLFANVLSWPLIGAMFIGEYVVRRVWFAHLPQHTPSQTIASALAYPMAATMRSLSGARGQP
jgi:uncharacterized membrane protein